LGGQPRVGPQGLPWVLDCPGSVCPEGAWAASPGLARKAYPGYVGEQRGFNPNGVAAVWGDVARNAAVTPLGLMGNDGGLAPPSQGSRWAATLGWRPKPRCG